MLWQVIKAVSPFVGSALIKAFKKKPSRVRRKAWTNDIRVGNMLGPNRDARIQSHSGQYVTLRTSYYPDAGLIDFMHNLGYRKERTDKNTVRAQDGKLVREYHTNFKMYYWKKKNDLRNP